MKNKRFQDQPYQIAFSATSIVGGAAYLYILIVFSTTIAYLLFLLPLSYIKPEQAREIWQFGIWTLWIIAFLSGVFLIGFRFSYKREIRWLGLVALLSNWIIWNIVYALNFLGMYPTSVFVPSVAIATVLAYFLLDELFIITLQYNHYLSRSMSFAEQGSIFLALISAMSLFLLFGRGLRSIISRVNLFSSSSIVFIFQLISLALITHFAANINLNDPRSSRFKTIICLAICFAVVIAKYSNEGYLSFWWLGMAALSSSVFYIAHSPTKRKSTGLAIGLFSAMSIAIFLDNATFATTTNQFWTVIKDYILPALGIIAVVVVGGGSLIKTVFPKLRSQQISNKDVMDGSQDFIEVNGFSIHAIDQIIRIAILSKDFDFCDKLSREPESFHSNELREYFEIYYLCVRFAFNGHVRVIVEDNVHTGQQALINSREGFISYINKQFPSYVHDYDVWYGYASKSYITGYISEKTLSKARPDTLYTRSVQYLRNAFIILLVFLIFSSQVLGPWMNVVPSLVSQLATWNSTRKNEVRLVITLAMQPYQHEDPDVQKYYALSMWNWVQNKELYVGEQRNGHFYMSTETMETQIKYLETIFSFYEDRDDFYFKLSNEIGGYYQGLGNCNKAFKYFQEVLTNSTSIERRDIAIAKSADCYRKEELPKALTLLQEAYDSTDYIQSRTVLADIYCEQGKYDEVVKLLDPTSASIDPVTLSILGESLYQEGMYTDSIEILEKALASDSLLSDDDHRIHSYLYLGAAYFKINKPFDAAENFFKAFSEQICSYNPVLSTQEEEIYIPRFKSAIDSVSQQNPADFRTNLWNFVYFLYNGETENASNFFKANLIESPEYEQKFSECVLNMVKSK